MSGDPAAGPSRRHVPTPAKEAVLRPAVLEKLTAPDVRLAVVAAPAGYGKTTHVSSWLVDDPRPAEWIDLDALHTEPAGLLESLVDTLATVTDLDSSTLPRDGWLISGGDPHLSGVAAALGRAVRRCSRPFVLVLDDVHALEGSLAIDLVDAIAVNVPAGSTLVLIGRSCWFPSLPRLRGDSWLVEIDMAELTLDVDAVARLLRNLGVAEAEERAPDVLAVTEGWPVGVRMAALSSGATSLGSDAAQVAGLGHEPRVAEYLAAEWLHRLDEEDRTFLLQASMLDWLSGPICTAVFGRSDAGEVLYRLCYDQRLLIPLDQRGDDFRMHALLREALSAHLERCDPSEVERIHQEASAWFEHVGDPDAAVRHAVAGSDFDRAARLVIEHAPALYANGRHSTIKRWVDSLPREWVVISPGLCLTACLAALGMGDRHGVQAWLRFGEVAASEGAGDPQVELCLLDLRSTTTTGAATPARDAAEKAYRGLPPGIWHTGACLIFGAWSWLVGEGDPRSVLQEGADEAAVLGAPALEAYCTAVHSVIAFADRDAEVARSLALHARQLATKHGLERTPGMAIVFAQHALVAATVGDLEAAEADRRLARALLAQVREVSGWGNVLTRLALVRVSVLLGDRPAAETLLREAREHLAPQHDAVQGLEQVALLEQMVATLGNHKGGGAASLTTAELRVLHYLPTNLTLAEIAGRLFVSRYTVKTHCASIYRKLDAGSRSQAVEAAQALGLLTHILVSDDL